MDLTAQTAAASTVHHPFGSPSGPGLFRVKGLQLPAYIQNVAHALQRSGSARDESTAIQMAVGVITRWAAGDAGHGKRVHPDVQAAAARALAEWEAAKASAHAHSNQDGGAMTLTWNGTGGIELSGYLPPHVPAGSPTGGQFGTTSGGQGAASSQPAAKGAKKKAGAKAAKKAKAGGKPKAAGAPSRAAALAQKTQLQAQAKADRDKAAAVTAKIHALTAAIHAAVKAAAGVKAAAATKTSATATAAAAVKAAATTAATTTTTAAKTTATTAKAPTIAQMRTKRTALRSQRASLLAHAAGLESQAAAIKLSSGDDDGSRFLEMAFAEALTERVPPGKAEGGQFHARTSLTRHDTPEEAARAVNAMSEQQRAAIRTRILPPPGFEWARGDRLAAAR